MSGAVEGDGRPRLLDLFCGAGGAALGYHRAGFDVVGVDIELQPHYPFHFIRGDASRWLESWMPRLFRRNFDAIHASPECQGYTTMNNRHGSSHLPQIPDIQELLEATGLPYVIENVSGALSEMRSPIELTGEMFGLRVHRPRLFESNVMLLAPPRPRRQLDPVAVYGKQDGRRLWTRADGSELRVADLKTGSEAMGIDWMTWDELREAIPPAYTQHIGGQLVRALVRT